MLFFKKSFFFTSGNRLCSTNFNQVLGLSHRGSEHWHETGAFSRRPEIVANGKGYKARLARRLSVQN